MFRPLRIKFIAFTLILIALVMGLSFTTVCIMEQVRSRTTVENALKDALFKAADDHKDFPEGKRMFFNNQQSGSNPSSNNMNGNDTAQLMQKDASDFKNFKDDPNFQKRNDAIPEESLPDIYEATNTSSSGEEVAPPAIGMPRERGRDFISLIPLVVYRLENDNSLVLIPRLSSASIENDILQEALQILDDKPNGFGELTSLGLNYYKEYQGDNKLIAFADLSYTSSWQSLALVLFFVGIGSIVVFFIILLFYSNWALRPVKEAWSAQRQFVADASHDLKTPLTVILANTSILLKRPHDSIASQSQWVESTQSEAHTMQRLINEMLELAQVESATLPEIEKENINFSELVEGESLLFDSVAFEKSCRYDCSFDDEIIIKGNEDRLHKLVSTLIENAFKYVDESGQVKISLKKENRHAVLSIFNSGNFIDEKDLEHIFDRFYRTDKARTSSARGFGLGLAIARQIAHLHNGSITCSSEQNSGTTFEVRLPLE